MKRALLLLFCILTSLHHYASDFRYMVVQTHDGLTLNIALNAVEVRFEEGQIAFVSGRDTLLFDKQKVKGFRFSRDEEVKVEEIFADTDCASGVEVFDIEGRLVGRFSSQSEMERSLPSGIYILKSKMQVFKVLKQ